MSLYTSVDCVRKITRDTEINILWTLWWVYLYDIIIYNWYIIKPERKSKVIFKLNIIHCNIKRPPGLIGNTILAFEMTNEPLVLFIFLLITIYIFYTNQL